MHHEILGVKPRRLSLRCKNTAGKIHETVDVGLPRIIAKRGAFAYCLSFALGPMCAGRTIVANRAIG